MLAAAIIVGLGYNGPYIWLFGYMATGDQHKHDHRHLPDGLSNTKHPEP